MKTIQTYSIYKPQGTTIHLPIGSKVLGTQLIDGEIAIHVMQNHYEERKIECFFLVVMDQTPFDDESELTEMVYIGTIVNQEKHLQHVFEMQW